MAAETLSACGSNSIHVHVPGLKGPKERLKDVVQVYWRHWDQSSLPPGQRIAHAKCVGLHLHLQLHWNLGLCGVFHMEHRIRLAHHDGGLWHLQSASL